MAQSSTRTTYHRYRRPQPVELPRADRVWPDVEICTAPTWCSIDLRDGNQALPDPMDPTRKQMMFDLLVKMGFREIEVGFPAASTPDYEFIRSLIDEERIPDDVTIQVLTQCRAELIERTYECLRGARRAIVHFYNSTSAAQRQLVFREDKAGTVRIATSAAKLCRQFEGSLPETEICYEYSPESFTATELDFALDICASVTDALDATPTRKLIVNLPATVETYGPNVYADVIECFTGAIPRRDAVVLSVHPHNDRGCAVAAAELAVMAGAERVEGTLFGNGERTGNVDIVTLALNLFSHGVDPGLDLSDIDEVRRVAELCTKMTVHARHPYAGELVYTAFSGSHQDAIKKGIDAGVDNSGIWSVPYLPIDPTHVGRTYEALIRVNSQSGKGGVAYVIHTEHGLDLPRGLQLEFSKTIQSITELSGTEIGAADIWTEFERDYFRTGDGELRLVKHQVETKPECTTISATMSIEGREHIVRGLGTGPVEAFLNGVARWGIGSADVVTYQQHSLGTGAAAKAVAYTELRDHLGRRTWGVGIDANTTTATLNAVLSALRRQTRLYPAGNVVARNPDRSAATTSRA